MASTTAGHHVHVGGVLDRPTVVGRAGFPALKDRFVYLLEFGIAYDVWVHVWNLG